MRRMEHFKWPMCALGQSAHFTTRQVCVCVCGSLFRWIIHSNDAHTYAASVHSSMIVRCIAMDMDGGRWKWQIKYAHRNANANTKANSMQRKNTKMISTDCIKYLVYFVNKLMKVGRDAHSSTVHESQEYSKQQNRSVCSSIGHWPWRQIAVAQCKYISMHLCLYALARCYALGRDTTTEHASTKSISILFHLCWPKSNKLRRQVEPEIDSKMLFICEMEASGTYAHILLVLPDHPTTTRINRVSHRSHRTFSNSFRMSRTTTTSTIGISINKYIKWRIQFAQEPVRSVCVCVSECMFSINGNSHLASEWRAAINGCSAGSSIAIKCFNFKPQERISSN